MRRDFAQQSAVIRLVGYVEGICGHGLLSNEIEANLIQRAEALLKAFDLDGLPDSSKSEKAA